MKVKAPGSGLPPVAPPEADGATAGEVGEAPGAASLTPRSVSGTGTPATERTSAARTAAAASESRQTSPVAQELGAALEGGRVGLKEATQKLIEHVLDQQVGPDAPVALREKLRGVLAESLESDPVLKDKLRALG